jgi:rhamnosyltransferase
MICFVIVLYKCELINSSSYNSITNSLIKNNKQAKLLVWDNSPFPHLILPPNLPWIDILYNHSKENRGVSLAYNYAAECASASGYEWIGLLDQDTVFSEDFILKIEESILNRINVKLFVPIIKFEDGKPFSPSRYKFKRGYSCELSHGLYSLYEFIPINSGMIINVCTFKECGGYNNDVWLDFSDCQFIERFRLVDSNFCVIDSIAYQDFSNNEPNLDTLTNRFSIFCECARASQKNNFMDYFGFFYTTLRHTLALSFRTRSISFFSIFMNKFVFKK